MEPSENSTNARKKMHGGTETEFDRRARLASFAITRGQTAALRRHLDAGLDPDSLFHDGFSGPRPWPLIERALMMDQFDCCVVLEEAGATLTRHVLELAICHCGDDRYLSRLIASGKLDLDGGPEPGVSWIDFAEHEETGSSKRLLLQAICERERAALDEVPARPVPTAPRRFL